MPQTVGALDRLRIERYVWSVDQQIYDLPLASRIAKRRELRANLLSAAADVGTGAALGRLGSSRRLALDYLDAEFGGRPRPAWITAAYVAGLGPLVLNYVLSEAANAYQDAIVQTNPHATGSYTWHGIEYVQSAITFSFTDGQATHDGGAWTPGVYVVWLVAVVAAGRLWRLLPRSGATRSADHAVS